MLVGVVEGVKGIAGAILPKSCSTSSKVSQEGTSASQEKTGVSEITTRSRKKNEE
jgi:hypothetical protein